MSSCFDITLKYKAKDTEGLDKTLKDKTGIHRKGD